MPKNPEDSDFLFQGYIYGVHTQKKISTSYNPDQDLVRESSYRRCMVTGRGAFFQVGWRGRVDWGVRTPGRGGRAGAAVLSRILLPAWMQWKRCLIHTVKTQLSASVYTEADNG